VVLLLNYQINAMYLIIEMNIKTNFSLLIRLLIFSSHKEPGMNPLSTLIRYQKVMPSGLVFCRFFPVGMCFRDNIPQDTRRLLPYDPDVQFSALFFRVLPKSPGIHRQVSVCGYRIVKASGSEYCGHSGSWGGISGTYEYDIKPLGHRNRRHTSAGQCY